jgi:hypothetical protein
MALLVPRAVAAQGGPPPGKGGGGGLKLTLSQTAISFPTPGVLEFDAGWVDASEITAAIDDRGNPDAWELRIRAEVPDMGGYGKPVADILFRPQGSSTWTPVSTTDQVIAQGTGSQSVTIFFRLRLDYASDLPNNYAADLTFYVQAL